MKYSITEAQDYKAIFIVFPNGVKIYVNNLHPDFDTIRKVLEDEEIDNQDIAYMLLVMNLMNVKQNVDELQDAITLKKAQDAINKYEYEVVETSISPWGHEEKVFITEEELVEIVSQLSKTGDALGFDYTPQLDYESEEEYKYVRQGVFPALVVDGILLAFDDENNGVSYYVAGISNISYVGMNKNTTSDIDDIKPNRFILWMRKIFLHKN